MILTDIKYEQLRLRFSSFSDQTVYYFRSMLEILVYVIILVSV